MWAAASGVKTSGMPGSSRRARSMAAASVEVRIFSPPAVPCVRKWLSTLGCANRLDSSDNATPISGGKSVVTGGAGGGAAEGREEAFAEEGEGAEWTGTEAGLWAAAPGEDASRAAEAAAVSVR